MVLGGARWCRREVAARRADQGRLSFHPSPVPSPPRGEGENLRLRRLDVILFGQAVVVPKTMRDIRERQGDSSTAFKRGHQSHSDPVKRFLFTGDRSWRDPGHGIEADPIACCPSNGFLLETVWGVSVNRGNGSLGSYRQEERPERITSK